MDAITEILANASDLSIIMNEGDCWEGLYKGNNDESLIYSRIEITEVEVL